MPIKLSPLALAVSSAITLLALPAAAKKSPEYEKDAILVVYKKDATEAERADAQRLVRGTLSSQHAKGMNDKFQQLLDGKLARLGLRKDIDIKETIKILSRHPAVKYAEPNYIIKALGVPDDPNFAQLWAMQNTGQNGGVAGADIKATEAWDISTGSNDIVVGVIDTGVDYNHPDLVDNIWVNPNETANGQDDDGNGIIDDIHGYSAVNNNGDPMDGNGHGTHVSGTIGAKGNNGMGVVGVNWDVKIAACQFLNASGSGTSEGAIACINYFTDLKVNHGINIKVTNNSWGGGGYSQALKDSIDAAGEAGILFVAAAGNDASDNDMSPSYPASYESSNVMAIASTDRYDNMSSFSQFGVTSVDMGAPGSEILSTVPDNAYATYSGTSMATPHVVGAAALAWSVNPDLTVEEMKQLLMDSGDANPSLNGKTVSGTRLNVARALEEANPLPSYKFTVSPTSQSIEAGSTARYDFTLGSIAGWEGNVDLSVAVTPALEGVSLSASRVAVGEAFTLDVATLAQTPWGEYTFTVSGTDGEIEKSKMVSLQVFPQGLNDFTYTNTTRVEIPDDNDGIFSTIEIADDVQIFGLTANVDISHTWIGDLRVTLTSPAGTEAVLHNRAGGSADDIVKSWDLSVFDGQMTKGAWTLSVDDNAAADVGTLNSWGMMIRGLGEAAPAAPIAGFEFATNLLAVTFTNTSTDVNDDIESYSWSFGDGATSTEMNPTHIYSTSGSYTVSLTATDAQGLSHTTESQVVVADYTINASVDRALISRRGTARVDLIWSGSPAEQVSIYRDGELVVTTDNVGHYRERFSTTADSVSYQVCDEAGSICSEAVVAEF